MTTHTERSSRTKELILQAAEICFSEDGYSATSINRIAHKAGVSPATIYLHFSGKLKLFECLQESGLVDASGVLTRREEIVHAALHVFSNKGVEGASMEDIASAVGLTKGALYGYFVGKDDLLSAVLQSAQEIGHLKALYSPEKNNFQNEQESFQTIESFLYSVALGYLMIFRDPDRVGLFRILLEQGGRNPQIAQLFFKSVVEAGTSQIAQTLEKVGFSQKDDLIELARAFMGMLVNWVLMHRILQLEEFLSPQAEEKMADQAVRIFLFGIKSFQSV
jgi:AcrR family transcriptional regulator